MSTSTLHLTKETEQEARERLAAEAERDADDWMQRARHANYASTRRAFVNNADRCRRRAAALRKGGK